MPVIIKLCTVKPQVPIRKCFQFLGFCYRPESVCDTVLKL